MIHKFVSNSSVILICQGFQCIFRKSLLWSMNKKNDKRASYKKAVDFLSQVHDFKASPKFYYSDQETPMD